MEMKIQARYKNGVLVPIIPLDMEENKNIQIILTDELYEDFSTAGEDDDISTYFQAQKEVIEND